MIREDCIYLELKNNPFIVDLVGYLFDPYNPYLLLPFYEKGTLNDWVGKTNWYEALVSIQNISGTLQEIHTLGGFHRDIKPANIFIDEVNNSKIIKLRDFGIGRLPHPFTSGDMTNHPCGTDEYIAPELYLPNPKYMFSCDIYSLGITGIALITGSRNPNSILSFWIKNDVKELLLRIVNINPNQRPHAKHIKK